MPIYSLSTNPLALASPMLILAKQWYVPFYYTRCSKTKNFIKATSEDAAADIAAFVAIFFENFSQFKGRAFHMAGESYGVCFDFSNKNVYIY